MWLRSAGEISQRSSGLYRDSATDVRSQTQKITRDLNIPHAFNDWRAMVKHEEVAVPRTALIRGFSLTWAQIDIVSVVTPPDTHANISIEALRAGKHVLCDKPTAFDAKEAAAMAKAAQAAPNQVAWIDHELRFLDITQKVLVARACPSLTSRSRCERPFTTPDSGASLPWTCAC